MSDESRVLAGILFLSLVTVETGGLYMVKLWKDAAGGSGTSNVTDLGGGPPAAGDPSVYFDAASGTLVVLYRAGDGNIHSLSRAAESSLKKTPPRASTT